MARECGRNGDSSALARVGKSSLVFNSSSSWNWEADKSCIKIHNNSRDGHQGNMLIFDIAM